MQDQLALMKVRSNCEVVSGDLPQPSFHVESGHKTAHIEKFSIVLYFVNYLLESLCQFAMFDVSLSHMSIVLFRSIVDRLFTAGR